MQKSEFNSIKLTDNHLSVIIKALEVYYRLRSGQISMAISEAFKDRIIDWDKKDLIERHVQSATHPDRLTFGVGHEKLKDANLGYEILKTLEEFLSVKKNGGYWGNGVNFNGALKVTQEPLPKIEGFNQFKDVFLTSKESQLLYKHIKNSNWSDAWAIVDKWSESNNKRFALLKRGNSDKKEIILDKDGCPAAVRVWKPRNI